jgi:protein phosphatase
LFGESVLRNFLEKSRANMMIRGHQCVESGAEELWGGSLITVFSASNYCGNSLNKAGVVQVDDDGRVRKQNWPGLQYLMRGDVTFVEPDVLGIASELEDDIISRLEPAIPPTKSMQSIPKARGLANGLPILPTIDKKRSTSKLGATGAGSARQGGIPQTHSLRGSTTGGFNPRAVSGLRK